MKKNKLYLLLFILLPVLSSAQFFGGIGRGDVSSQQLGNAVSVNENQMKQPISFYIRGNTVCIDYNSDTKLTGEVVVYNMVGQTVLKQQLTKDPSMRIKLIESTGCYLIKLNYDGRTYTKKVLLIQE